jgi:tetratricopeptide (TPR) repeat protein/predicted Ser/Thr protein kinase
VEACPDENVLVAFATRGLRGASLEAIERHIDACPTCMEVVAHAACVLAPAQESVRRIDRYTVQEELGRGGMGIVYAAYDPVLERRVALKVLRHRTGHPDDERLLREARAMAHLSHPNVVPVFDVGHVDDGSTAFIAMELVEGTDLRRWLATPRAPSAIWDVLRQAGRGLAAAHAAGVVHRDFKPANVLVDADGRARVTDFGLAHVDEGSTDDRSFTLEGGSLTLDGAVAGTPAYMAPEQLHGHADDPRVDQFSFCVAVYEALGGARPFSGRSLDELHEQMQCRVLARPNDAISRRAWRVIARGLAFDPEDRWPSMDALLQALESAARPRRRIAIVAAMAIVLATAAAWAGSTDDEPCLADERWLDAAWGPERRAEIEAALLATDSPYAPQAWSYASMAIDRWAQRWIAMRIDACAAVHVRHEQTPEVLDLRTLCLDRRRDELAALTDALTRADAAAVEALPDTVTRLTPLSSCADVHALRSIVPLPESPGRRAQVYRARITLHRVTRSTEAGRYEEARAEVDPVVAQAVSLQYEPLRAEALLARGRVLFELGELDEADRDLAEAVLAGISGGDARSTATAAALRASVLSAAGDPAAAIEVAKTGIAAADRLTHDAEVLASLLSARGTAYRRQGRYEEARAALHEALELAENELGSEHPRTAVALVNLANVDAQMGKHAQAREGYRRAIAIQERVYGSTHPVVANTMSNLAIASSLAGDHDEAAELAADALALSEAARGSQHAEVVRMRSNLGVMYAQAGRYADALAVHERALAARRRAHGDDHPDVAESLNNVGQALFELGRLDEADAVLRDAYEVGARISGATHPSVLTTRYNQARAALGRGAPELAVTILDELIAARIEVLGPEHPHVASTLFELARAHDALGHTDDAARTYAHAASVFDAAGLPEDAAKARAAAQPRG